MGIRTKFLCLLLLFSILPLLAFMVFHQQVYQALGGDIYEIARLLLLQTAARELQETAQNHGDNIRKALASITALIRARLRHSEGFPAAASPDLQSSAPPLPMESLKRTMASFYDDLAALRRDLVGLKVSFGDGTIVRYPADAPLGVDPEPFENVPSIWAADNPADALWIWPGGPDGFRPTERPPVVRLLLPLRAGDGSLRAIFSAGFDMLKVLEAARPSSQWSPYMRTCLLRMIPGAGHAQEAPLILSARKPSSATAQWQAAMVPFEIAPRDSDTLDKLFRGSVYGSEGYVSLLFEDEATLIAYAQVDKQLGLVNLLPEREVLYRIARHPQRLGRWLMLDSVLAAGAVIVVLVLLAVHRSRRMLDPFFSMITAFNNVSEGHFATRLTFKARDERRMVADAFNQMVVDLEEGFRSRQALEVAHEVQHNFLPEPRIGPSGFDIAVRIRYCEETGGDYIDFLERKEERIGVLVGDVTGHGIGAALLMATARALIRGAYGAVDDLAGLMDGVNRNLCADMGTTGRFVTLFMLEIDLATREMTWVRAGHDPAWHYSAATGDTHPLEGPGIALGVDATYRFTINRGHRLEPGDIVLIGTDGIWETTNPEGDFFGKGRIESLLSAKAGGSAAEISGALMEALDRFRRSRRLADDVSLAVVRKT